MRRVLVPGSRENFKPRQAIELLEARGCEVVFKPLGSDEDEVIEACAGINAVVAGGQWFTRRVLEALPKLRVISRVGVGYDRVDVEAATELGVMLMITPGANSESVADWAMTLLMTVTRGTAYFDREIRAGEWPRDMLPEISGKTLGIIGLGHIGKCTAKRGHAFDMPILAFDVYRDAEFAEKYGVRYVELDELLRESDFISIHCPLNKHTEGLISAREFGLMKRTAFIVNTARGPIIHEPSLIEALQSGQIAGAGLDVFTEEPLQESPLRGMPNVILAPHIASSTDGAVERMMIDSARNIADAFDGLRPPGLVNKDCVLRTLTA